MLEEILNDAKAPSKPNSWLKPARKIKGTYTREISNPTASPNKTNKITMMATTAGFGS